MKAIFIIISVLSLTFSVGCSDRIKDVSIVSDSTVFVFEWLTLLDNKKYDDAWNLTSEEFRETTTKQQWIATLEQYRLYTPMPDTRHIASSFQSSTLHDLQKRGQYVSFDITTKSVDGDTWREAVIVVKKGKNWEVIGYTMVI